MAISAEDKNFLVSLYVGYFNRAPDPAGLQFWIDQVEAGRDTNTIAADFAASPEAKSLYPFLTTPDVSSPTSFITAVYANLFNRAPDAAGQAFWEAQLSSGAVSPADAIDAIIKGATTAPDSTILANKNVVGLDFATDAGNTPGFTFDLGGASGSAAKDAISGVTEDSATVTAAQAATDAYLSGVAIPGQTFTLTTGVDVGASFTGTTNNDTFIGVDSTTDTADTINVGDSLDGGAGTDTFRMTIADNDANPITLANIENVEIIGSAATGNINAQNWAGVSSLTLKNAGVDGATTSAAQVSNLASNVTINLDNVKVNADNDTALTVGFASGAVGTSGTATVNATNVGSSARDAQVVLDAGGSDVFTTLALTATGSNNVRFNAAADADVELTSITVGGTGSLDLEVDGTNVEMTNVATFNASANSGGVTADVSASTATNQTVTGGSGNDSLNVDLARNITLDAGAGNDTVTLTNATAANLSTATNLVDSIKGGAGTDTLVMTAANAASIAGDTAADRGAITEFEVLRATGNLNTNNFNINNINSINSLQFDTTITGGEATVSGFTSGATVENRGNAHSQTITVGGTFEATDIFNFTVNGQALSHTVVAGDTNNDGIATAIAGAINAALGAGTASATGSVVTVVNGFVSAVSTTETGGGAADAQTVALATNTRDLVVGMTGATNAGTNDDALTIALNGDIANNSQVYSSYQVDGINNITITTADRSNTDNATSRDDGYIVRLDNDNNVSTITATGSSSLNFATTADSAALQTFTATGLSGDLTLDLSTNGLTQGVTVTGGSGTNVITGTGFADNITGGARADTITTGNGADTATGGAGADTFIYAAGSTGGSPSASNHDTITDFGVNSDIIDFAAALTVEQNATASTGVAAINAEGIATFVSTDDTLAERIDAVQAAIVAGTESSGDYAIFEHGGNSYVFIDDGAAGGLTANDVLIELVGVTGLTDSTIAGGNLTIG